MTLVQTYPTAADSTDAAGPQVWDDMTVEVALSVMAAARTGRLAVRDGHGYTDRIRLRDVVARSRRSRRSR